MRTDITDGFNGRKEMSGLWFDKGEVVIGQRVEEGLKAGVFFNVDPKTVMRAKNKRRQTTISG
jgi:hypothetical protein